MQKDKLIVGASLIVIFISTYGMLKTVFDALPTQPAASTTVATTGTPTPSNLPVSATLRPEPTPEPTQSPPASTVATTATSAPSNLPVSTTPGPEPIPALTQSTPTISVQPTHAPKPLESRVIKHQPDQFRKGALSRKELYAIKKAITTIQWSRNPDPKAAADEDYAAIVKECENGSLHDLLADLVTEAASNDYQPDNEAADSIYTKELISDFETGAEDERKAQKLQSQQR